MKSIVLIAAIQLNGVSYPMNAEFHDTVEHCQSRIVEIDNAVRDWRSTGNSFELLAKCHKITKEVSAE